MKPNDLTRICLLLVSFVLILFLNTCKKDEDKKPDDEVIIPETTRVITEDKWDYYFISADSTDWTLTMDPGITLAEGVEVGDVLVVPKGQGLLRKVTGIQSSNGVIILTTEFASVCDAIEKGSFTFQKDLSVMMKQARVEILHPGTEIRPVLKDGEETEISFTIEVPIHEHIDITGELSLDPSISGEVIIGDYSLDYLRLEFTLDESFELTSTADIASLEFEKEQEIARVTFPTITVLVGTVPVLITPEFVLKLGVNVTLSSELSVGVIQELSVSAGIEYQDGEWSPISGLEKSFGHSGPELSNSLEAKAYIKPELSMLIYGVVSPTLSTELYGLLEAEMAASPWWTLYAGLSADIGIKVKIWVLTLADYSVNLFDLRYPIADAENPGNTRPNAVFSITPASGSIDTVFVLDASGSFDAEDPATSLEARWDWQNDGTWDTEFSSDLITEHQYISAGVKTVKVRVRDSGGLSDEETHTVNVTWGAAGGGEPCPGLEEFEYEGQVYHTTLIGDRCWMKENLNVGTMLTGNQEPSDNGIFEKFCYNNDPEYCELYGGLYFWDELMDYDTVPGTRGICPPGWHVPTDEEWSYLEGSVDSQYGIGHWIWNQTWFRGSDVAVKLKSTYGWEDNGNGTDDFGFTALPGGTRYADVGFSLEGDIGWWFTSSMDMGLFPWVRVLHNDNPGSDRGWGAKGNAHSVRCIKD